MDEKLYGKPVGSLAINLISSLILLANIKKRYELYLDTNKKV